VLGRCSLELQFWSWIGSFAMDGNNDGSKGTDDLDLEAYIDPNTFCSYCNLADMKSPEQQICDYCVSRLNFFTERYYPLEALAKLQEERADNAVCGDGDGDGDTFTCDSQRNAGLSSSGAGCTAAQAQNQGTKAVDRRGMPGAYPSGEDHSSGEDVVL